MSDITSIKVDYKHVQGWHVFTSEALPGLYVASEDPEKAYEDVARAVEMLIELDTGAPCRVVPESSFTDFLRRRSAAPGRRRFERSDERTHMLASKRYALCAEPA